jgi:hypothetical protein
MIDSARGELRMKDIPMTGFISVNDTSGRNQLFYKGHSVSLGARDGCQGAALALASNDNDAALASLMLSETAVDPVGLEIGGADIAAEIGAVYFDGP